MHKNVSEFTAILNQIALSGIKNKDSVRKFNENDFMINSARKNGVTADDRYNERYGRTTFRTIQSDLLNIYEEQQMSFEDVIIK